MLARELRIGIHFGGYNDGDKLAILTLLNCEFSKYTFYAVQDVNPGEVEPKFDAKFILINQGVDMAPELSPFIEIGDEYTKLLWPRISRIISDHPIFFSVPQSDS